MKNKASDSIKDLSSTLKTLGAKPSPRVEALSASAAVTAAASKIYWPDGVEEQVTAAVHSKKHTLLYGPPGTGKSTMGRSILDAQGIPYQRVQYHRDMDAQDHIGSVSVTEKNGASVTDIIWSPNIEAIENGTSIVGDEFDTLNPATAFPLYAQLDDSPFLTAQCNGVSRYISKHPDFFLIATSNTNLTGDDGGNFAGTDIQNEALVDRFEYMIHVGYLRPAQELQMMKERIKDVSASTLKAMVEVAGATRSTTATCGAISSRRVIAWANAYKALRATGKSDEQSLKIGAEMAILSRVADEGIRTSLETFMHDAGMSWA